MEPKNTCHPKWNRGVPWVSRKLAGFTLVELIVVITILVILGTIAFVSLSGFSGSARDSSRVSDLSLISKSFDLYYAKQGSYPSPTGSVAVTYSGAAAWYQWTVGDSVILTLWGGGSKISRKPTDPLLSTEYTYSLASELREYSLAANHEGSSVSLGNPRQGETAYAETGNPTLTYTKGNYNGVVTKVSTGSKVNLLAVPNIITASGVLSIIPGSQTGFLVNGQTNSGYLFTPRLVYSSWALPNNDTDRITFASGVVVAYSGTSLASNGNIMQFITASSSTGALASIGGSFVGTKLGGTASIALVTTSFPVITCTGTNVTQTDLGSGHGQCVFSYTWVSQTLSITSWNPTFTINAWGAGGVGWAGGTAGGGGAATMTLTGTTGDTIVSYVWQRGIDHWAGGGGTYVLKNGVITLVVWGGGGCYNGTGGGGGVTTGGTWWGGSYNGWCGGGGRNSAGGNGSDCTGGWSGPWGAGGTGPVGSGGYGGGGAAASWWSGGGGGWYTGGNGATSGGNSTGGSSYTLYPWDTTLYPGSSPNPGSTSLTGYQTGIGLGSGGSGGMGNGLVVIYW